MAIVPLRPSAPAPLPTARARPRPHSYEIGYGKPPKASRFKKGASGNPKGRPRSAKSLNTIVRETMLEKVPVRTGRGERRVSRAEALVLKQLELASKGNMAALSKLLQLFQVAVPDLPQLVEQEAGEMSETDAAILAALKEQLLQGSTGEQGHVA